MTTRGPVIHSSLPSAAALRLLLAVLLLLAPCCAAVTAAQSVFRYVSTKGDFNNDGLSWATAKNNLQNAIDEVYDEIRGTSRKGYVYVAGSTEGMTFVPSRRSTSDADASVFNTSFSIYPGVSVYGGFAGSESPSESYPEDQLWKLRIMDTKAILGSSHPEKTYEQVENDIDADNFGETVRRWNFKYKTILSGNHSTNNFSFTFSESRGIYSTNFPLSSYHVVWFATNGKLEPDAGGTEKDLTGHFKPIEGQAVLDGVTIEGGYASSTNLKGHDHTAFGGGVYMVRGAVLRNSIVRYCAATQRGGAVYLDGGGEVERCYIHTSQVTGYGMQQGYGGGVCIDYDGAVQHTYIIQCAARIGAGLAICHVPKEYPEHTALAQSEAFRKVYEDNATGLATPYDPFCVASVISNCTSNAEGGGVYLDEGGTLNHCTVVRNKCVGPDIIYYGRRHGRTGGIYVRNRGTLYNTVAWGNESPVNNDVQFASFKDAEAEAQGKRIAVYHCAFSRSDITDWATATKDGITSLTNENTPETKDAVGNFPIFNCPTTKAGIQYNATTKAVDINATGDGEPYQRVYNWHPLAASMLRQKGVQVSDALQGISAEVLHAHTDVDIIGRRFEAISSVGALAQSYRTIALMPPLNFSLEKGEEGEQIPTLLVDPARKAWGPVNDMEFDENGNLVASDEPHAGYLDNNVTGECWEHPIGNLGNAIRTLKRRQVSKRDDPHYEWYNLGGTKNADGSFTGGTFYPHAQICVKEGSITTAGPDCYLGTQARTSSIRPASNMRIYGGFPKTNTQTRIDNRNQRQHPTIVSSNVLQSGYMNNGAHVFVLMNVHNVIIDGFRLYDGNANLNTAESYAPINPETGERAVITFGGGVFVQNNTVEKEERQDMTGNIIRNCVIANCSAPDGAAIYVEGNNLMTDPETGADRRCRGELTVINCILRNNTAGDMHRDHNWFVYKDGVMADDDPSFVTEEQKMAARNNPDLNHKSTGAVVTADGNAHIWLRNCDIVSNCGYAMEGLHDENAVDAFQIEIYNSIIFSNGQMIRADRTGIEHPVTCKWSEERTIIGNYIYIDWDAQKPPVPGDVKCFNYLTRDRLKDRTYATADGTASATPLPSYTDVFGQQMYATEHGAIDDTPILLRYPYFVNPSRNVGHSEDGDRPLYGGIISYEPLNLNPIVNGACGEMSTNIGTADLLPVNNSMAMDGGMPAASSTNLYHHNCKSMPYDAAWNPRTYGGAPDAGAIEGVRLPKGGAVIYVTPDGAGKRDGSSWDNAIAGNTIYALDESYGTAGTDQFDTENGTTRIVNADGAIGTGAANGVTTSDQRYCGGFAKTWFTERKVGAVSNTAVLKMWVTEKNVYDDGGQPADIISDGSTPTETTVTTYVSQGANEDGFSKAGWYLDERYPYGELSGQTRTFWRANPYQGTYNDAASFIASEKAKGWINNRREEHYVGGLQYAVEKAAAYNALPANDPQRIDDVDSVMVWVGNGKYTDYKGFIMRDKTTVLGSFPVSSGGTPGLGERQALMSAVVSIPKSLPAQNLNAEDYETILQVSDTDPKKGNLAINEAAINFWDDDLSKMQTTDTRSYKYQNKVIIHHFGKEIDTQEDQTATYLQYANMKNGSSNALTTNTSTTTENDIRYRTCGTATETKDCWHVSVPADNYLLRIGNYNGTGGNIYDNGVKVATADQRAHIRDGSLTGVNIWQTMKNVEAGDYMLQLDMAAFYYDEYAKAGAPANYNGNDNNPNTNVYIYLLDASDNVLAKAKAPGYAGIRSAMKRVRMPFTVASTGDVTFKVTVGPGLDKSGEEVPDDFTLAMNRNPNRREINMTNLVLYKVVKGENYVEYTDLLENYVSNREVADPEPVTTTLTTLYDVKTHRTTLRKRVLTMPDVCVPTFGGGGIGDPVTHDKSFGDALPHTDRVTGDAKDQRTASTYTKQEDPYYVGYTRVTWDGFTIRHGFLYDEAMTHGGGAGVNIYEGARLRNCIVINNFAASQRNKGGGIFCDGATSSVEGCFVLDNTSTRGTTDKTTEYKQVFAGGMFMYEGTCFNSLFAKNYSFGSAGGVGFCVGRFYNNTIAYNTCDLVEGGHINGGGISLATSSNPNLFVANTVIYGNSGMAIRQRYDQTIGINSVNPFIHCYIQSEVAFTHDLYLKNIGNHSDNASYYGIGNVLLNGVAPSAANTPFAADLDFSTDPVSGVYTGGAATDNDYRLTSTLTDCINMGTEDFAGSLLTVLTYKGKSESSIKNSFLYKTVDAATLPETDVAFADRVQDCQIDMGAYEFDGTKFIEPDLSQDGKAIFYVSQNGAGMSTGSTPEDAACKVKLQKVLDAAGRWKYAANFYMNTDPAGDHYNLTNFTEDILRAEITRGMRRKGTIGENENLTAETMADLLATLKDRTVIVKLAGDYYRDSSGDYTPSFFKYSPTRSTSTDDNQEENLLEYSFMVPRGVQVLGGYTEADTDDGQGGTWPAFSDITRDVLSNHTLLSGEVTNTESGVTGNTFHVVTFVEDLFAPNEKLYANNTGMKLTGQLSCFSDEKDRAVLDGLYIQEGYANGTSARDRRGAGAIVTGYAHIRNCIVQYNEATGEGGGLYMEPSALVSGSIIKRNTAYAGGGIYVEEPSTVGSDTYARVITSTVVFNSALTVAGGMHFDTNVRANSSAFWKNSANDLSNVAGTFTNDEVTLIEDNCAFNYCGVESRRISGVNNIELPVAEDQGVRWNHIDDHEVARWNVYPANSAVSAERSDSVYYYPINLSSVLGRAGMTYAAYAELCRLYPTMELVDIGGLNRLAQTETGEFIRLADGTIIDKQLKNNAFIEMGARVLNGSFELHVEYSHVMTRLFVTTTQLLPTEEALTLQNNTVEAEMIRRGTPYAKGTAGYQAIAADVDMYKQMGSTFLNPFHRLGDALEYIVRVRNSNETFSYRNKSNEVVETTVGDYYRNVRFEVFVSSGTFYPFRDAHGMQGEARANTFVVPEEVTIVGGCNREASGHNYCQETSGSVTVAGMTLDGVTTEQIRAGRERMDRNGNHVKEPWEMQEQTILSGNAVNNTGSNNTNVYHVITCFPDESRVGKLPSRWDDKNDVTGFDTGNREDAVAHQLSPLFDGVLPERGAQRMLLQNLEAECRESRDRRTIFIDGLTITGGHANDIENDDEVDNFQKLTYFRGGGILVEGNWDNTFDTEVGLPEVLGVAKRDIPLVTTNCLFQDNTGGNGGAVYTNGTYYAFGCHFTKNTACGPNTGIDQKYIPWTAGGAIANNYEVHLWNCLFDNNEAMRGKEPILEVMRTEGEGEGKVEIKNPVFNADARQGYAGAISCSETGLVRVGNCDFVRNKAVAFPAIYNFIDNNLRAYSGQVYTDFYNFLSEHPGFDESAPDLSKTSVSMVDGAAHNYDYYKTEFDNYYYGQGHHFAVNSIFWGNEATAETVNAFSWQEYGFYNWRESTPRYTVINEETKEDYWSDSREPDHVANFGPMLDISTLTFCALEEGTGREGTVWHDNHDRAKSAQILPSGDKDGLTRLYEGDFIDVLYDNFGFYPAGEPERPIYKKIAKGGDTYEIAPCNPAAAEALILDADGITERKPNDDEIASAIAYNYNLVLDSENLDPNGPYFVQPSITAGEDGYMETADWLVARLNRTIDTGWGMLKQNVTQASETSGFYNTTLLDKDEQPVTSTTNQYEELWGEGFFNLHAKNVYERFKDIGFPNLMPIGDAPYMDYSTEGTNEVSNMRRISTHPKMGVQNVFIDMGIYEYQYVQLITGGDQTDVIWVAETENQNIVCDGSTRAKATSDLQGAIETLLLSRNDHDKMIKLLGGNYSPMRMTEANQRAFYINVPSRNTGVVLPAGVVTADSTYAVRSLTIRGGYSTTATEDGSDGEATRDTELNPTVLRMVKEAGSTDHQLEHLFIIEDAEVKGTYINYLTKDNKDFENYVMPIVFEGITFSNPYGNEHHEDGGAAIIYHEQYRTVDRGGDSFEKDESQLLRAASDPHGNPMPKLIIKNCTFVANGKDTKTSAVKINKGGGQSLIVNSLFHSNSAEPIDAVNTKVINCTFALNGGHLTLKDETETYSDGTTASYPSAVHNSIIWRDDLNNAVPGQLCGPTQWDNTALTLDNGRMTHNAYVSADSEPDGTTEPDARGNFLLSKENDDVLLGPNFTAPTPDIPAGATEEERLNIMLNTRDFHLGPSAHVLNRADAQTYIDNVPYYREVATQQQKELKSEVENGAIVTTYYWFHSVQHDFPTTLTEAMLKGTDANYQEHELGFKYRWLNAGLERGAYECTASVDRVLYVWEGTTGKQDGTTWEHAFDIDELQKAIDVASVYSLTSSPQERAYVFVKASEIPVSTLRLRDGVSVFGSIANSYSELVEKNMETDHYDDDKIDAFVARMQATRGGIATKDVAHNTIRGLISENNSQFHSGFLLDGFWITAGETATTPVNMVKDHVVLRNDVIAGSTVSGAGLPVVNVDKGLLYNTLVYNNTPGSGAAVVNIGTNGYALNNTVVAPTTGTAPLSTAVADHSQNNIAVNAADGEGTMFAPYLTNTNAYTLPSYLTDWQPYAYQLHEQTAQVNGGTDDNGDGSGSTVKDGGNSIAKLFPDFVDFSRDRDLLGNPRRLSDCVDNGCFETWKVSDSRYATNTTNTAFTQNYGGHRYPHEGSVVYVMENASLVFARDGEGTPLFTEPISPGYVLVKPGGSVYGQGNPLQFGYVAVDKTMAAGEQKGLMAFPHDVNASATVAVVGTETLVQTVPSFRTYTYDGAERAKWDYKYSADNSTAWVGDMSSIQNAYTQLKGGEGWLFELTAAPAEDKTLRFTGWGPSGGLFVYTEDGSDKTVTLTQYDNHPADGYAHFTAVENMGWNLKGLPWLVADYKTAAYTGGTYDNTSTDYQMNVPHVFYSTLDNTIADGAADATYGQFYTSRSWDEGVGLSPGQGFFTQTAVIGDEETLTFRQPLYSGSEPAAAARMMVAVTTVDTKAKDVVQVIPQEGATAAMPYQIGSDGVKWFAFNPQLPQLFVLNADKTALSLVSAAPVDTEIALGIRTADEQKRLTISLPVPDAYADYEHVWLTDHVTNTITDLLLDSYTFTPTAPGFDASRLTLRFGGKRPMTYAEQQVVISIRKNQLRVTGLIPGDIVAIYTVGGMLVDKVRVTETVYERELNDGIFIVRAAHATKKVLSR